MKQVTRLLLCAFCVLPAAGALADPLRNSRQCLVVTTASWSAGRGSLQMFERDSAARGWKPRKSPIPVVVGKAGMAWGNNRISATSGPTKVEGDNRAPAGIFDLTQIFGYAERAKTKMPYLHVTTDTVCVDDAQSPHYNRFADKSRHAVDWRSGEKMRRNDNLYKWGVVVNYNGFAGPKPRTGAGSCIFLHIWRGPDQPTVGCTAMAEKDMVDLIHWLDPARKPVLVQMPRPAYEQDHGLPPLR